MSWIPATSTAVSDVGATMTPLATVPAVTEMAGASSPPNPVAETSEPPAAKSLTDAEYRALARFRFALRVFLRFSRDAARSAGVTPDQHQLLLAVRGSESGAPTISELAELLQIRHHSAGELIDRAVDAGLLARTSDPDDARLRRLVLSAHGSKTLESLSAVHRDELRRFHAELAPILNELSQS